MEGVAGEGGGQAVRQAHRLDWAINQTNQQRIDGARATDTQRSFIIEKNSIWFELWTFKLTSLPLL